MTFKLQPDPTFWATAELSVPGQSEREPVPLQFRHQSREEWRVTTDDGKATVRDVVTKLVVGWRIEGEEFSPAALERLLNNYLPSAVEIYETYVRESQESKRKN